jgi:hypothetical protein
MACQTDEETLVASNKRGGPIKYFSGRAAVGLGSAQIVFGVLTIIAQIVILRVYDVFSNAISQGIWCGVAFIVCGTIGVIAGKRRTFPWVVAQLVFCILVCLFAAAIIALSALTSVYHYGSAYTYVPCQSTGYYSHYNSGGTGGQKHINNLYWNNYYYGSGGQPCTGPGFILNVPWVVQFSLNLIMGCLGILSAVLAIVAATLSCAPLCCNPDQLDKPKKAKLAASEETMAEPLPEKVPIGDAIFLDVPTNAYHI